MGKALFVSPIFYADNFRQHESTVAAKIMAIFFTSSLMDFALHPLHVAQSRFILQNRLPGFFSYKSLHHFFRLHFLQSHEIYKGCWGMLPINLVNSVFLVLTMKDTSIQTYGAASILSTLLTYPIVTAMRRYECQNSRPGMIPVRYSNIRHGLKLIANEEGVKGLYRGFAAFSAARLLENMIIWLFVGNMTKRSYR